MRDFLETGLMGVGCVAIVITTLFLSVIQPLVSAFFAFVGINIIIWLLPLAGNVAIIGAHSLGLNSITVELLPATAAFLAFVGAYFRSSNTNKCEGK